MDPLVPSTFSKTKTSQCILPCPVFFGRVEHHISSWRCHWHSKPSYFEFYMFEVVRLDLSRNLLIIVGKRSIDGSKIRSIFVSWEMQSHIKDESVNLSIHFHSKEWHPCNNIILFLERSFLFTSKYQINDHKSHDDTATISSSTYSNEPYYPKTPYDDEESITTPHSSSSTNIPQKSLFSTKAAS